MTPLYIAARDGQIELVENLISIGADVNYSGTCNSCLLVAVFRQHIRVIQTLLRHGADANWQRHDSAFPLNVACDLRNLDIVRVLVNGGADVNAKDDNGWTPLIKAASSGDTDMVDFLIERGADVNVQLRNGYNGIIIAASKGHSQVVLSFIKAGVNTAHQGTDGKSALIIACEQGHQEAVAALVEAGANLGIVDEVGWTPLLWAADKGHVGVVKYLIGRGGDVDASADDNTSCLLTAAFEGHTNVVRELLAAKADPMIVRDDGTSPLFVAASDGHEDIVRVLVDHGAGVNFADNFRWTPLMTAAQFGHLAVVKELIGHGAKVNATNRNNGTSLMLAVDGQHTDVVRVLLAAGADVNIQRDDGDLPLGTACKNGNLSALEMLLDSGADIESRCADGRTPLWFASARKQSKVVEFLLNRGAKVNSSSYSNNESCLMLALYTADEDTVRALLDVDDVHVNAARDDGNTPLYVASVKGSVVLVDMLVNKGARLENRCNFGNTPLWAAASRGHAAVVRRLINYGANPNCINYVRQSPLVTAAVEGRTNIVELLMQYVSDVSGHVDACEDALSAAAGSVSADTRIIQLLLQNGASVNTIKNERNETVLFYAVRSGQVDIVKLLVDCGIDPHVRNSDNLRAEDVAGYYGHVNISQFLARIQSSSAPQSALPPVDRIDCYLNNVLHRTSDVTAFRALSEKGVGIETENVDGQRPIHCAVRSGIVELVKLLIQRGANVDASDIYGNRPLHEAACHGLTVVELLVRHGARLNVQNINGKTPLHNAVECQQSDIVKFLLNSGADVEPTDVWGNTSVHYITRKVFSVPQISRYCQDLVCRQNPLTLSCNFVGISLLSHLHLMSDVVLHKTTLYSRNDRIDFKTYKKFKTSCTDLLGNTSVHRAVGVYGHYQMFRVCPDVSNEVDFLLDNELADINVRNNEGLTPLHVARRVQATKSCLLHADDRSFTITDKRGRNFWHLFFAQWPRNSEELPSDIQRVIASPGKEEADDLGRTPLHYACMNRGNWQETSSWLQLVSNFISKLTVETVNKQDLFGRTAQHCAIIGGNDYLQSMLKRQKVDHSVQDNFDRTAEDYGEVNKKFDMKASQIRLPSLSGFIVRNFCRISSCVEKCFDEKRHGNCQNFLRELMQKLRDNESPASFVAKIAQDCQFQYNIPHHGRENEVTPEPAGGEKRTRQFQARTRRSLVTAIRNQVENAMKLLAEQIATLDDRFECDVVPVGSGFEGNKIGLCNEFDYNFVLLKLSDMCEVHCVKDLPTGFVLLKARSTAVPISEEFFSATSTLDVRLLKFRFEALVKQVLSSVNFVNLCDFEFVDPVSGSAAVTGTATAKLNTQIRLVFTKPVDGYHLPHDVWVDIVPALRIRGWWPPDANPIHLVDDSVHKRGCHIVFTQLQSKHPWIGWTEPHGLLSFALPESNLLRESPLIVRTAYMVVRRMARYFCQYELYSSYVIKTAVLYCMAEDKEGRVWFSRQNDDDVDVDEDKLLRWVRTILRRLLRFSVQDYVPSYFMPQFIQPVLKYEKYLKFSHSRLRKLRLTYRDLFRLDDERSKDYFLQRIKAEFVCCHLLLWSVLSENEEYKLCLPSDAELLQSPGVVWNSTDTYMPKF